jgi:hypothetical protein
MTASKESLSSHAAKVAYAQSGVFQVYAWACEVANLALLDTKVEAVLPEAQAGHV